MGISASVRSADIRAAMRLVGECRDFRRDPAAWRRHSFEGLHRLIGVSAVNGGVARWPGRQGFIEQVLPIETGNFTRKESILYAKYMKSHGPNHPIILESLAKMTGRLSTGIRSQMINEEVWRRAEFHSVFIECGLGYSMLSMCEREGWSTMNVIAVHRSAGERDFTARERNLFHLFHDELSLLVGPILATISEPHQKRLAPRLQQTLDCLLQGDSEKQAALRLGLSKPTLHQYVTTLYRRFGVRSRAELLARFVR